MIRNYMFSVICNFMYWLENLENIFCRLIWSTILILTIIITAYMFNLTLNSYRNTSTITVLKSTTYDIRNVPFPGVAICNVNKISRKQAELISKQISTVANVSENIVFGLIKWFGKLYDFDIGNISNVTALIQILEQHDDIINNRKSLAKILKQLSPSCDETVVKCYWLNQEISCDQIIKTRNTADGFCCTYNYVKVGDSNKYVESTTNLLFSGAGIEDGLTLVLYSDPDDYYYPTISAEGFSVKVFNPHDYPDVNTGGVAESFMPLKHEVFLQISPTIITASPSIKNVPLKQRGCVLEKDGETVFDTTFYSYSDCLADCKIKSMLSLCDCVPFFLPVLQSYKFSEQICGLPDIFCLNRYKEKWMNIYPSIDLEELDAAREDSMFCPQCVPSCSYISYSVDTDYLQLSNIENKYTKNLNLSKHSIIHIYSDTEYAFLYESDILDYWFDVLSNLGGLCGLFMGFSVISIVEFLYFITVRFYFLMRKNARQ